jgi:hypothetical protein
MSSHCLHPAPAPVGSKTSSCARPGAVRIRILASLAIRRAVAAPPQSIATQRGTNRDIVGAQGPVIAHLDHQWWGTSDSFPFTETPRLALGNDRHAATLAASRRLDLSTGSSAPISSRSRHGNRSAQVDPKRPLGLRAGNGSCCPLADFARLGHASAVKGAGSLCMYATLGRWQTCRRDRPLSAWGGARTTGGPNAMAAEPAVKMR